MGFYGCAFAKKMYIFVDYYKEQGFTMKIKFFLLTLLMTVVFSFAQDPAEESAVADPAQTEAVEQSQMETAESSVDLSAPADQAGADQNDANAKSAAAASTQEKGDGLTWRGWTRIASFSVAALCIGGGIFENIKAEQRADDYNKAPAKAKTYGFYKSKRDDIKNAELLRNVLYGVAGGAVVIGLTTFAF